MRDNAEAMFTWDYSLARPPLRKLYEKAKTGQWNATTDLPWDTDVDIEKTVGEWNYEEVTVKGSTIKVELNGTVILNGDVAKVTEFLANKEHPGKDRTSGSFGLAGHNDPVAEDVQQTSVV